MNSQYTNLPNRGSNPVFTQTTKTEGDKFEENSEKLKIQNLERYKNSDQNYKTFKSDTWKRHWGQGGREGISSTSLKRVKLNLYNKGHLNI